MTLSFDNAVVYDIESFPNLFSLNAQSLHSDAEVTFEISEFRDDRQALMQWFNYLAQHQVPMIGFNNIGYDYPMIHNVFRNPNITCEQIHAKNNEIIGSTDRFGQTIWPRDRFAPQIDLRKVHHLDNRNKMTSLKALQFVMRAQSVMESAIPFGVRLTEQQARDDIIPYNSHDTHETKRFALYSLDALNFRIGLIEQFGVEVMNYNDTKIGEEMLIQRIGEDVCFDRVPVLDYAGNPVTDWNGNPRTKRQKRQTVRGHVALADIIFPYIQFQHPEFQRILDYMRGQTLHPDELKENTKKVVTKGVFTGLTATIDGFDFVYGTGGIHGSVSPQRIVATDEWLIRDIDVEGLYPRLGIVNRLAPAHLGEAFISAYATLPAERKEWQAKKGKKCAEANSMKLAGNGAYGKSNDEYSVLFDPQYTMSVTINGQLLLSMLAEWLMVVETLRIIAVNTDGITYQIHASHLEQAKAIEKQWEAFSCLTLEDAAYSRMFVRDVNNYVAEYTNGERKLKGAYFYPDPARFVESIAEAQPPGWHRDWSCPIVQRAAVAAMTDGYDPEHFMRCHTDPFDFMLRAKVSRGDKLLHGDQEQQKITRYYVSTDGKPLLKVSPPTGEIGAFKRRNKLTDGEYHAIASTLQAGQWDERIHTSNKSRYEMRSTAINAGFVASICNQASDFRFDNLNYDWYVNEARKLIIA